MLPVLYNINCCKTSSTAACANTLTLDISEVTLFFLSFSYVTTATDFVFVFCFYSVFINCADIYKGRKP